jgi:hypothetical protein
MDEGRHAQPQEREDEAQPKIQRSGRIAIDMTSSDWERIIKMSQSWSANAGIRWLMENLYILPSFLVLTGSVNNIRENPDGSPRDVEWVCERSGTYQLFVAYPAGQVSEPGKGYGNALGWINHRYPQGQLVLMIKNTKLSRSTWSMAHTSKTVEKCSDSRYDGIPTRSPAPGKHSEGRPTACYCCAYG